jgi:hypothetical protein
MAEGAVEGAGVMAKAASAGMAGALWGIFASAFLVIPAIFGSLFAPALKKTHSTITRKLDETKVGQGKTTVQMAGKKMSKVEREHQARLTEINADLEEQKLRQELARLSSRRKTKSSGRNASAQSI